MLLVAEEAAALERAKEFLRTSNGGLTKFDPTIAVSLDDAFHALEADERVVDAIVLDLSPAGNSGVNTFDVLQSHAPQTPVVVLASREEEGLVLDLLKRGAQDILPISSLTQDTLKRSIIYSIERKASQAAMGELNSALKDAEDRLGAMQLHLIEAKKLESLGRMASGVAHEVKNPLGMLQMGVDFFQQHHDPEDTASELILKRMREAIDRADGIIRDMVDFSRSGELILRLDNLNEVLETALSLTHHDLTRGKVNVKTDLTEPMPAVKIDRSKIEQVFVNIITNALHAMPDGGDLEIKTYWGEIDDIARDEGLRSLEHLRSGDNVVVVDIRDYGSGIPEEKLDVIFDPFFTTKPTGMGTGLGLAVAKAIVDLHRGLIRIKNVEPNGVQIQVIFRAFGSVGTEKNNLPSRLSIA